MKTPDDVTDTGHATIPATHHWTRAERRQQLGRSNGPECVVVGHAWAADPGRDDWMLCLVWEVVRGP